MYKRSSKTSALNQSVQIRGTSGQNRSFPQIYVWQVKTSVKPAPCHDDVMHLMFHTHCVLYVLYLFHSS